MTLTDLLVATARQQIAALLAQLAKAEQSAADRGAPLDQLLMARLAPDMYPLAGQLMFVSFLAEEALVRLRGADELPTELAALRERGWASAEQPGTWNGAKVRLQVTLDQLEAVVPGELDPAAERPLTIVLPNGMTFGMTGYEYVRDWALPQLYFHLSIAYGLMRQAGVPLGKVDFIPHLMSRLKQAEPTDS